MATVSSGDFEWDADKAVANAIKHGVTFEEAVTVFLDLDCLLVRDAVEAERFAAIGMTSQHGLCSWCIASGQRKIRIIKCMPRESSRA